MANHDDDDALERALADLEILQAAYPEEVSVTADAGAAASFPLRFTLRLDAASFCEMELLEGYPTKSGVGIVLYRSPHKSRIETVAETIRRTARECLEDEMEGALACCGAALETWQDQLTHEKEEAQQTRPVANSASPRNAPQKRYGWISGEPLMDRKSTFQAHVCRISTEKEVYEALHQLLDGNSKLQRATHNMYAWRVTEHLDEEQEQEATGEEEAKKNKNKKKRSILKHDNDDDGEDAAGSRLAQLLQMRGDDGVIVVVSRWFGGIHLGPKRFAHITNVARALLVHCHETNHWKDT